MMNKTKAEIEQMASFICREKGQYMFNKKEIGIITGLCKDKVAEPARTFLQPVTAELSYISSKMY
jgi:hypothetical protein